MSIVYLVQYGRPGFVGCFRAPTEEAITRDDRVVVRTPRGLEIGTVLCEPVERFAHETDDGELVRPVTEQDEAEAARLDAVAQDVFDAADAAALPIAFVDVEATLDGTAILHGLPWDDCDATPMLAELAARYGLNARLLDLSRSPVPRAEPEPAGCGKPGCGSGSGGCSSCGTEGGGCSTGSCSRGKVQSADDLTAYFANLRQQMEAASNRTPLI